METSTPKEGFLFPPPPNFKEKALVARLKIYLSLFGQFSTAGVVFVCLQYIQVILTSLNPSSFSRNTFNLKNLNDN